MKYTQLGNTGLEVSRICLGCMSYGDPKWRSWVMDAAPARPHFERALEHGINFFDTADMYSAGVSEEITGRALGELASRDDYVLASKVYYPLEDGPNRSGLSRKHILEGCDASLKRLGTDFIDLYQIHRWDPDSPVEEVMEALDSLVRAGKVRYLGASSMAAWQFSRALYVAGENGWHRFVSMQNHYNLVYREEEREVIPLCMDQGVGVIPWSPLARGFLAGSRLRDGEQKTARSKADDFADEMYFEEADFKVLDAVLEVAGERGIKPAQVAFAWLLSVPAVTAPIIGATKVDYIDDAVAALDIELTDEEIKRLEAPYTPHPILGHDQPGVRS